MLYNSLEVHNVEWNSGIVCLTAPCANYFSEFCPLLCKPCNLLQNNYFDLYNSGSFRILTTGFAIFTVSFLLFYNKLVNLSHLHSLQMHFQLG